MHFYLRKYAETLLKHIILFEKGVDGSNEYVILEDLKDTAIPNYLSACIKSESESLPTSTIDKDNSRWNAKNVDDRKQNSTQNKLSYFSGLLGFEQLDYEPYYTVMEREEHITYQVINVPFQKSFFEKIVSISQNNIPYFTIDEICIIITEIIPHNDRPELFVYAICIYLYKNPDLVAKMRSMADNSEPIAHHDYQTNILSSFVFNTRYTKNSFREIIDSHVTFMLINQKDKNDAIYALPGQKCKEKIVFCFSMNNLLLGFLIKHLLMNYRTFEANQNVLNSSVCKELHDSLESVTILDINNEKGFTIFNSTTEEQFLAYKLDLIMKSELLQIKCIKSINLYFGYFCQEYDFTCLENLKNLNRIICWKCSLEFVRSIPKHIQVEMHLAEDNTGRIFRKVPKNVVESSFNRCHIYDGSKIPDTLRSIAIQRCRIGRNDTLVFDRKYDYITVEVSKVTIIKFCECFLFEEIVLGASGNSTFRFTNEYTKDRGSVELINAKIVKMQQMVTIGGDIRDVTFEHVKLPLDTVIAFEEGNQRIKISKSRGAFDLKAYIGSILQFKRDTMIEILPTSNSTTNLSRITLQNIQLEQNIVFADTCVHVELINIRMINNSLIKLNKACKQLVMNECNGAIDINDVNSFDRIVICFCINGNNDIKFIGSQTVDHLHLHNICTDVESITSNLKCFKNVKHLQFTFNYSDQTGALTGHSSKTSWRVVLRNILCRNPYRTLDELLPQADYWKALVSSGAEHSVNYILSKVLSENSKDLITKLELSSVAITQKNYKLFVNLPRLSVLNVQSAGIHLNFFKFVPMSLRILNISDSYILRRNSELEGNNTCEELQSRSNNINVITIDVKALLQLHNIGTLLPSLQIIKIEFDPKEITGTISSGETLNLRQLLIMCDESIHDQNYSAVQNCTFIAFIRMLAQRINLRSLQRCIVVSKTTSMVINPITFEILTIKHVVEPDNTKKLENKEDSSGN
ncbi:putative LRR containing protein [Trachipleistophora hominis]|uniref:Putative LRR containing protein n=1 Tax=Trachipleistophora hominis TaxID=72359 RepID=L7JZY3_TRAHO|nr:putative LRR containing protein [Trachipleistophora hominis]